MANKKRHAWLQFARVHDYPLEVLLYWPQANFYEKERGMRIYPLGTGEHTKWLALNSTPVTTCIGGKASIVSYYGKELFSTCIMARNPSLDWKVSYLRCQSLHKPHKLAFLSYEDASRELYKYLREKIVVGHRVQRDLLWFGLRNRLHSVDTSALPIFKCAPSQQQKPLMSFFFKIEPDPSPTELARAGMLLYRTFKVEFDEYFHINVNTLQAPDHDFDYPSNKK